MKASIAATTVWSCCLLASSTSSMTMAFLMTSPRRGECCHHFSFTDDLLTNRLVITTPAPRFMFSGAGGGMPAEDKPEDIAAMEKAAATMGMSLEEYKLGVRARTRLTTELDAGRVVGGNKDTVAVERDGHNPPRYLEITITEAGKKLGKEQLSKELVAALKSSSTESRTKRMEAQRSMMTFISEEMKKMGIS